MDLRGRIFSGCKLSCTHYSQTSSPYTCISAAVFESWSVSFSRRLFVRSVLTLSGARDKHYHLPVCFFIMKMMTILLRYSRDFTGTDKDSHYGADDRFMYAVSEMQGWRICELLSLSTVSSVSSGNMCLWPLVPSLETMYHQADVFLIALLLHLSSLFLSHAVPLCTHPDLPVFDLKPWKMPTRPFST